MAYIKLHRKLTEWEWYTDANTMRLFLHLLFLANWKDTRYKGYDIPRGSLVTGRKKLAEELKLSEQNVRTALSHLELTNEITIKKTNKFTIITVNNYDKYQVSNQQDNQQLTNNQPTTNQQLTTSEEYKNIKNINNNIYNARTHEGTVDEVLLLYNKHCNRLPVATIISTTTAKNIIEIVENYSTDVIVKCFKEANKSDFLCGAKGFKANLDWLMIEANFTKVVNGGYAGTKKIDQHEYDFDNLEKSLSMANERKLKEWKNGE